MDVLVVNCGSSTLKFRVVTVTATDVRGESLPWRVDGVVERIGSSTAVVSTREAGGRSWRDEREVEGHEAAMSTVLRLLGDADLLDVGATAHRIVHGGSRFTGPTLIDDDTLDELERLAGLAPLHNRPALEALAAARQRLGARTPAVAVFDTAFHRSMPGRARAYAIAQDVAERHGLWRFGFHGLAHRWMSERYAARVGVTPEAVRLVTLQLGNGCSAAAVEGGRSVDTTMGLTPLEGLMMGTRSGDVDPALVALVAEREGMDAASAISWLNEECGLLGVSGTSADVRDLLGAEAGGDTRAGLALEMFCYRARKVVGAYDAVLGGADAVVFGGGIGEHAPAIRARICDGLERRGLLLDPERNARALGTEATITADRSTIRAEVLPVDEATLIAGDAARVLAPPSTAT